ncbi:hypothetical protein Pan216_06350 [Planctomycetes bacterium Pan216]|uniref:Uncharacterized protein n=1 Tax=Kolteria novifilia TaxID=2527975 RepID=A0A518AYK0_9BACT|nr:hypothetical protein Pan216_06350 [Planctomycetes bacterium Pan216]
MRGRIGTMIALVAVAGFTLGCASKPCCKPRILSSYAPPGSPKAPPLNQSRPVQVPTAPVNSAPVATAVPAVVAQPAPTALAIPAQPAQPAPQAAVVVPRQPWQAAPNAQLQQQPFLGSAPTNQPAPNNGAYSNSNQGGSQNSASSGATLGSPSSKNEQPRPLLVPGPPQ